MTRNREPFEVVFTGDDVRKFYAVQAGTYRKRENATCKRAYARLIRTCLKGCGRVLEIGGGASRLLEVLDARFATSCDLSVAMLRAAVRAGATGSAAAADGYDLPYRDGAFDGVFCVNVLEHVPAPQRLLDEASRVLCPGGRFLAVTPNGDVAWLLGILETLHLKIPEGPHRFLRFAELGSIAREHFTIREHKRFLALPAGPEWFVSWVDRVMRGHDGRGLFQYVYLEKHGG